MRNFYHYLSFKPEMKFRSAIWKNLNSQRIQKVRHHLSKLREIMIWPSFDWWWSHRFKFLAPKTPKTVIWNVVKQCFNFAWLHACTHWGTSHQDSRQILLEMTSPPRVLTWDRPILISSSSSRNPFGNGVCFPTLEALWTKVIWQIWMFSKVQTLNRIEAFLHS